MNPISHTVGYRPSCRESIDQVTGSDVGVPTVVLIEAPPAGFLENREQLYEVSRRYVPKYVVHVVEGDSLFRL